MERRWTWRGRIGRALLVAVLLWGLAAPLVASAAPAATKNTDRSGLELSLSFLVGRVLDALGLRGEPPGPDGPEAPDAGEPGHAAAPYGPLIDPNGYDPGPPRTHGGTHRP